MVQIDPMEYQKFSDYLSFSCKETAGKSVVTIQ